jgi:SSS family solute:Na+ symporter
MDRMLHRGAYAEVKARVDEVEAPAAAPVRKWSWGRLIGLDEHFSRSDKWITGGLFWWSMFWFGTWAVGSVWNLIQPWPLSVWSTYWHIAGIGLPLVIAVVTSIWFTWGGVVDIRDFFRLLAGEKVNHLDDGTVIGHQNLDERASTPEAKPAKAEKA